MLECLQSRQTKKTVLFAAIVTLGACAANAQELKQANYLSPNDASCSLFPQFVSQEMGFFEEEGIRVNMLSSDTSVPYVAFLSNGDADVVALDAGQVLQAVDAGLPVKVIYEAYQFTADNIVVPADSQVQSLAELKGKTIGLASDRDMINLIIALNAVGLEIGDVTTAVVGDSGPILAKSLQDGTIAAFAGGVTDRTGIEAAGMLTRNITPSEVSRTPGNSLVAWGPTLEEKRDLIVGFLRGWAKGHMAGALDTKAVMSACKKRLPEQWENPERGQFIVNNAVYNTQLRRTMMFGEMQADVWAAIQDPYVELKEIGKFHEPSTFLEEAIIDEVNNFKTNEVKAGIARFKEANADMLIP